MQIALESLQKFSACDLNTLADETTRLELAGIRSHAKESATTSFINSVTLDMQLPAQALDTIADEVVERLNSSLTLETGVLPYEMEMVILLGGLHFNLIVLFAKAREVITVKTRPTGAPTWILMRTRPTGALATFSEIALPDFAKHVDNVGMIVAILNAPISSD